MKTRTARLLFLLLLPALVWSINYNRSVTALPHSTVKQGGSAFQEKSAFGGMTMEDLSFLRIRGRLTEKLPGFSRLQSPARHITGMITSGYVFNNHLPDLFCNLQEDIKLLNIPIHLFNRVFLI